MLSPELVEGPKHKVFCPQPFDDNLFNGNLQKRRELAARFFVMTDVPQLFLSCVRKYWV